MAYAIVADSWKLALLQWFLNFGPTISVRLYVNNLTPDETNVAADFVEASYPGYTPVVWPWGTPALDGAHKANVVPLVVNIVGPTSGGPVNVYGWFVTHGVGGGMHLIESGRLSSAPKVLADTSDAVALNLFWKLWDLHQP